MTDETHSSRERGSVPLAVERQIDENLRRLYQRQLEGELPESLRKLVAQLREEVQQR